MKSCAVICRWEFDGGGDSDGFAGNLVMVEGNFLEGWVLCVLSKRPSRFELGQNERLFVKHLGIVKSILFCFFPMLSTQ